MKREKYLKNTGLYDIFCCIETGCLYMVIYIDEETSYEKSTIN